MLNPNDFNIPVIEAHDVFENVLYLVYFAAGISAIIAIIIAGYTYVTANGNSASITKSVRTIVYSLVGLAVIMVAFAVTGFIFGRLK